MQSTNGKKSNVGLTEIEASTSEHLRQAETTPESSQHIPNNTFLKSFVFAFAGIAYVLKTQRNMRVHAGAGILVILAGIVLGVTPPEWAALLAIMALVYALEMLNTVVEAIVDMITQEYHPQAKVAKDVAAGAVLVAALFAFAIALVVLLPRFIHFISTLLGW